MNQEKQRAHEKLQLQVEPDRNDGEGEGVRSEKEEPKEHVAVQRRVVRKYRELGRDGELVSDEQQIQGEHHHGAVCKFRGVEKVRHDAVEKQHHQDKKVLIHHVMRRVALHGQVQMVLHVGAGACVRVCVQ